MGKFSLMLVVLGGALAGYGAYQYLSYHWDYSSMLEVGIGIAVIVCGLLLRGWARWR